MTGNCLQYEAKLFSVILQWGKNVRIWETDKKYFIKI